MSDIGDRVDALDNYEFENASKMAWGMLYSHGHAFIDLQPGDATTYKIVVVQPLVPKRVAGWEIYPNTYWVGTSFGSLYQYDPKNYYDWGYVADKWIDHAMRGGTREWTARVIARFLNALSDKLKEGTDAHLPGG